MGALISSIIDDVIVTAVENRKKSTNIVNTEPHNIDEHSLSLSHDQVKEHHKDKLENIVKNKSSKKDPMVKTEEENSLSSTVSVSCNDTEALFSIEKYLPSSGGKCIFYQAEWINPRRYMHLAGSKSKYYKKTIKCEGIELGLFLEQKLGTTKRDRINRSESRTTSCESDDSGGANKLTEESERVAEEFGRWTPQSQDEGDEDLTESDHRKKNKKSITGLNGGYWDVIGVRGVIREKLEKQESIEQEEQKKKNETKKSETKTPRKVSRQISKEEAIDSNVSNEKIKNKEEQLKENKNTKKENDFIENAENLNLCKSEFENEVNISNNEEKITEKAKTNQGRNAESIPMMSHNNPKSKRKGKLEILHKQKTELNKKRKVEPVGSDLKQILTDPSDDNKDS